MGDDDNVEIPVSLDLDKAIGDADTIGAKVADRIADKLRSNPDLEDFMAGINRPVPGAMTESQRKQKKIDDQKMLEDKERLAREEKINDYYKGVNLKRMVVEGNKQRRDEEESKARILKQTVQQGRKRLDEEEKAKKKIQDAEDKLLKQRKRDWVESLHQSRASSKLNGGAITNAIGGAAAYGYAGASGMVGYGFSGTVEGNQFAAQFKMLSREMAAIFKPALNSLSQAMATVRTSLEGLSGSQQDRIMNAGLAVGALSATFGIRNTVKAGVGGAMRLGGGGASGAVMAGGALATGIGLAKIWDLGTSAAHAGADPTTSREAESLGYRKGMSADARKNLWEHQRQQAVAAGRELKSQADSRTWAGLAFSTLGLNDEKGVFEMSRESRVVNRRIKNLMDIRKGDVSEDNDPHRYVKSADTVGFGSAGSTAEMIQEAVLANGGTQSMSETSRLLTAILNAILGQNSSDVERILNAPPGIIMPTLPSGLFYEQLFDNGNAKAYSETYTRDNNIFTAHLAVNWLDAQDFRRELLGHTEFDPDISNRFTRSVPFICPYTTRARALQMDLVNYGRRPNVLDVFDFDELVAGSTSDIGSENISYFQDALLDQWFTTHYAIYKVMFQRLPYIVLDDFEVAAFDDSGSPGNELHRFVIVQRNNNVRELRLPDFNFELSPPTSPSTVIPVNGFTPSIESEIIYTWFQIPFDQIPRDQYQSLKLLINDTEFDPVRKWPAQTMLFLDAKNIDVPYEGADGNLYCDPQIIFRHKQNLDKDGNIVGHNHVFDPASLSWVLVQRRNVIPTKYIYDTTGDFPKLFSPLGA